jgi:hypothetical protein
MAKHVQFFLLYRMWNQVGENNVVNGRGHRPFRVLVEVLVTTGKGDPCDHWFTGNPKRHIF